MKHEHDDCPECLKQIHDNNIKALCEAVENGYPHLWHWEGVDRTPKPMNNDWKQEPGDDQC